MCTFDLEHVKVVLGSLGARFQKLGRNLKTARSRTKLMKISASGVYVACMLVFLTLNNYQAHLGCTFPKTGAVKPKKRLIMGLVGVSNMHVGIFYLEHVKLSCGHTLHFSEKGV